jgi:hypothetical protein
MKRILSSAFIASSLVACSQLGVNKLGDGKLNSSAFFNSSESGEIEGGLADTKATLKLLLRNDGVPLVGKVTGKS